MNTKQNLNLLIRDLKDKRAELKKLTKSKGGNIEKIKELRLAINTMQKDVDRHKQPNGIYVSDHAVLRFIERVMGFDTEMVKERILTKELKKIIHINGDGHYPVEDFKVVVKGKTIATIIKQ